MISLIICIGLGIVLAPLIGMLLIVALRILAFLVPLAIVVGTFWVMTA